MKQLIKIQESADGKKAVSAREMYLSIGLREGHWQRWANKNIEKNPFAVEGVDWIGFDFVLNGDNSPLRGVKKGNRAKDYILSLDFAKKICMQARTQRGEDMRNYFLEVERIALTTDSAQISPAKLQELESKMNRIEAYVAHSDVHEFSIAGYASLCRKWITGIEASMLGKQASKKCKELGFSTGEIRDPRFGKVNTYPEIVLKQVFEDFFKLPRF